MDKRFLTVRQVDSQIADAKSTHNIVPGQGWTRIIRKILGMTIKQLASRLKVDPSRVVKIEMSEPEGAVALRTLHSVANALDCNLSYSFVPKTTLEETVTKRAEKLSTKQIKRISSTMALENQMVDQKITEQMLKDSHKGKLK